MGRLLGDVEDSKYLGVGRHRVRVSGTEMSQSREGKPCVTYTFRDMEGATHSKKLSLQPKALWKLKTLIVALGLPKEHIDVFDVDNPKHHDKMVGKELWIELVQGEKYAECDSWWSIAGKTAQKEQAEEGQRTAAELQEPSTGIADRLAAAAAQTEDDIPF